MKKSLLVLCALVLGSITVRAQTDYDNLSANPAKQAPSVGMTRAQALARYGEPFHRAVVDGRERWLYRLKFDEVYGRALVPFYISSDNVRLGTIEFGPNGRVKTFDWQRPAANL